jgi:hypothetical protein
MNAGWWLSRYEMPENISGRLLNCEFQSFCEAKSNAGVGRR